MIDLALAPTPAEIERRITHPDLDEELWRAARHRYALDGRRVLRLPRIGGASFLTGTQTETIYSNSTVGTAKTTFTSEAVINDTAGMGPQPILPPYFWQPSANLNLGRAVRLVARGIRSDVTTTPTWALTARLGGAVSTAGPNVGSQAATQISATAATNLLWEFEADLQLTVAGAEGANSTIRGLGFVSWQATTSTSLQLPVFGGGASPGTVATVDISITNHINFDATCGTSSASNSIQLLQLFVFGLN